jgi:hypothetical protein
VSNVTIKSLTDFREIFGLTYVYPRIKTEIDSTIRKSHRLQGDELSHLRCSQDRNRGRSSISRTVCAMQTVLLERGVHLDGTCNECAGKSLFFIAEGTASGGGGWVRSPPLLCVSTLKAAQTHDMEGSGKRPREDNDEGDGRNQRSLGRLPLTATMTARGAPSQSDGDGEGRRRDAAMTKPTTADRRALSHDIETATKKLRGTGRIESESWEEKDAVDHNHQQQLQCYTEASSTSLEPARSSAYRPSFSVEDLLGVPLDLLFQYASPHPAMMIRSKSPSGGRSSSSLKKRQRHFPPSPQPLPFPLPLGIDPEGVPTPEPFPKQQHHRQHDHYRHQQHQPDAATYEEDGDATQPRKKRGAATSPPRSEQSRHRSESRQQKQVQARRRPLLSRSEAQGLLRVRLLSQQIDSIAGVSQRALEIKSQCRAWQRLLCASAARSNTASEEEARSEGAAKGRDEEDGGNDDDDAAAEGRIRPGVAPQLLPMATLLHTIGEHAPHRTLEACDDEMQLISEELQQLSESLRQASEQNWTVSESLFADSDALGLPEGVDDTDGSSDDEETPTRRRRDHRGGRRYHREPAVGSAVSYLAHAKRALSDVQYEVSQRIDALLEGRLSDEMLEAPMHRHCRTLFAFSGAALPSSHHDEEFDGANNEYPDAWDDDERDMDRLARKAPPSAVGTVPAPKSSPQVSLLPSPTKRQHDAANLTDATKPYALDAATARLPMDWLPFGQASPPTTRPSNASTQEQQQLTDASQTAAPSTALNLCSPAAPTPQCDGGPTAAAAAALPPPDSEEKENSQQRSQQQQPLLAERFSWTFQQLPHPPPCLKDVMDQAPSRSASASAQSSAHVTAGPAPQPQPLPSVYTASQEAEASHAVAQVLAGLTTTTTPPSSTIQAAPAARGTMHPARSSVPDEEPITEYD